MTGERNCGACGAANPAAARFCMECGHGFAPVCPSCGAETPERARFCMSCGTALNGASAREPAPAAAPAPAAPAPPAPDEAPPEERRLATVLFADLSGYTAAASDMDPEAVKAMVDRTLRRLAAAIEEFGGTVDKFMGDNVMGVFGAPVAHEDDAERAVRAGLAMQQAMVELNDSAAEARGISFSLRVGINTGEVMAGPVGDRYTVMGDPVNIASRLEGAARPGTVTVGAATYRASRSAIDYVRLEPLKLKGKDQPVPAWEAVSALAVPRRGRARAATPLIGRADEAELLRSLSDRVAREGQPHLVTVVGQAGVGKSRLLREFAESIGDDPASPALRQGQCPPYGAGIAYWALGEVIREEFGIDEQEQPGGAWPKLRDGVAELMNEAGEPEAAERNAALIAVALNMEPPADVAPADSDPQRIREALFAAVRAVVEALSVRRPLVLAFEDIHWADEGMLDLIDHLARWVRGPLLLVCLTREELFERRPGWGGGRRNATAISLEPLSGDQTRELVAAILPEGDPRGGELVEKLADRAGGNPLFAEEMVNRLVEEDAVDLDALPTTVQSLLASRLDSLQRPERRLLLHAAVVGQSFGRRALEPAAEQEGVELDAALSSLQEKDLIARRTGGARAAGEREEFAFKHGLIRDVAYGMLPKSVRCSKHVEIGELIEARSGDRREATVGLVAEHFARAAGLGAETGLPPAELAELNAKALEHLEAAGDAAAALFSNSEALDRYTAALELSGEIDAADRARVGEKQGDLALRLGQVDAAVKVWEQCLEHHRASGEQTRIADLHRKIGAGLWHKGERKASIDNYQRGIDLLKDGEPSIELVRLYEEAASLYMHTGDNMLAIYASEKALRLAERMGEAGAASRAHGIFGRVFGRIGDSEKARENLERSVALAQESDRAEAVRALLTLGYHLDVSEADYGAAAQAYREAIEIAEEVGDVTSQVELHASLGQIAVHRADWDEVSNATQTALALAEREGLQGKLCFPHVLEGVLAWREGDWGNAEAACRRAHELGEEVGRSEVSFSGLFWLAAVLRDQGEPAAAELELATSLETCERAGLIVQRVEATAARAGALALAGRREDAETATGEAAGLAEQLGYPVAEAAAAEAQAMLAPPGAEGERALERARDLWNDLGRRLDAARCLLLRGQALAAAGEEGGPVLARAAEEYQQLGAPGLAARCRSLTPA